MTGSPAELLSLHGWTALVAGASGGIGRAIVARLAGAGATVIGWDRPGAPDSGAARHREVDIARGDQVDSGFAAIRAEFPTLDILVHAAGIRRDGLLWKLTAEAWQEVLDVNLTSAFHLLRGAVPLMRERGGSVVLVSSINGERGKRGQANYAASKAGLIGLARTAARDLGGFRIRVNLVAPGMIRTAMTETLPVEVVRQAESEAVLGEIGQPDDVARGVLFLASDMSRHVTGQLLRIDGGQLIG